MKELREIRLNNLKQLIEKYGQKRLAEKLDRTDSLLNSYKSSTVKKNIGEKFARHIETTLNLPYGWMDQPHPINQDKDTKIAEDRAPYYAPPQNTQEHSNVEPALNPRGELVPIISWVQAGHASEAIDLFEPGIADDWIKPSCQTKAHTYALRVQGDSMEPEFREGMILIVEPEMDYLSGDYVIAKNGDGEVTFKQYVRDLGEEYLKPLNPQYPIKKLGDYKVIGVVREAIKRLR